MNINYQIKDILYFLKVNIVLHSQNYVQFASVILFIFKIQQYKF